MAVKALRDLNIYGQVAVVGIAKRLEEIFYPGDTLPLYIDKKSESLKLIQRLRNEAHRFAITFHRSKRDAGTLKTELTDIKGIGPSTADALLQKYRSVKSCVSFRRRNWPRRSAKRRPLYFMPTCTTLQKKPVKLTAQP